MAATIKDIAKRLNISVSTVSYALKVTPAHLEVLSQWLPAGEAGGRARTLVIGGEALQVANLLEIAAERLHELRILRHRLRAAIGDVELPLGD